MGRWWTGYTSIADGRACIVHSHGALWLLAPSGCRQSSSGYGLFTAKRLSEKMRLIRSLRGAECELKSIRTEITLGAAGCFAAFDDLVTLTVRATDVDECHGPSLPQGGYKDKTQCDSNLSPSPLLKHHPGVLPQHG